MGQGEDFAHWAQAIIENPFANGCYHRLDGGARY
jgi:hypothetical protein